MPNQQVNTPMLISPIMMTPKYLTPKQLQELYLDQVGDMSIRNGPLVPNSERESTRVEIEKADYVERSTLMSAPILFQTMVQKAATCPFNYSSVFMNKMHQKALADKCDASIYKCGDSVEKVESVISCTGAGETTAMYFGLSPTSLNGEIGYADFLASIADNSFVFRQLGNNSAEGGMIRFWWSFTQQWAPTDYFLLFLRILLCVLYIYARDAGVCLLRLGF